jgi:Holliday junction DNA helicase RuvA
MIGYLQGKILEIEDNKLLLSTANGVGYLVTMSIREGISLQAGDSLELYIHTHVREDALDLFGFRTKDEKDLFLALLNVNGIGPKSALGILSHTEPGRLLQIIVDGDKEALHDVQGIGKKTADRIILEMIDPIRKQVSAGKYFGLMSKKPSETHAKVSGAVSGAGGILREAREALMGLGYREMEVTSTLNSLMAQSTPPTQVEELIRSALRSIGGSAS